MWVLIIITGFAGFLFPPLWIVTVCLLIYIAVKKGTKAGNKESVKW